MTDNVIELVEHTNDAEHWTPGEALKYAIERYEEIGGRLMIVALIGEQGEFEIVRAGNPEKLTILAHKLAAHELGDYSFEP